MKFETIYRKAKSEIKEVNFKYNYDYEVYLYNKFVELINAEEIFIISWRWSIQQNAGKTYENGKKHIKMMLRHAYASYFEVNIEEVL